MDYSTVDAIVRFFPVEWLPNLPSACGGHAAYADADLAIAVAGDARSREVPWSDNEEWVLKPALGRVGEDIGMSGVTEAKQLKRVSRNVRWFPSGWAAQRRFAATTFRVREKDLYPSVGIYTIDGQAAGAYGRIADFPSGTFLRSRGITEVVVLHDRGGVQEDLAHVLLRWQETGIQMRALAPGDASPRDFTVKKPSWFRRAWYRAIIVAGRRRNNAGGFGSVIPTPGGGGYG